MQSRSGRLDAVALAAQGAETDAMRSQLLPFAALGKANPRLSRDDVTAATVERGTPRPPDREPARKAT
jgi:hypothetical protein